ncbi:MAG: hypothetical protein GDA38_23310 [Hormoscilla sp. SP12CHS1]|nr:hypothetical protein [Hormoscilla sp. SP12CHS1]
MPKFQIHLYGSLIYPVIQDIFNLLQEFFGVHSYLNTGKTLATLRKIDDALIGADDFV